MEIQKPYIRTEPAVLKRQDYLLRSKEPPQESLSRGIRLTNSIQIYATRTKENKANLQPHNCPYGEVTSSRCR